MVFNKMKSALLVVLIIISHAGFCQDGDSLRAGSALKLIGLGFTAPELDSMQDELKQIRKTYAKMRELPTGNALAYPFAFDPAPPGFIMPVQQNKVNWNIPADITMPANRNDLAFFSITQLASLIKNKKITSVELTIFFLERLKKWGDTLECVITRTDNLAMAQAKQADAELKAGKYRGPLHGIPYGLKDLFAVKGYKTTWGAVPYKDQVIDEDAFVYKKLRDAGAILCAKLTLGELAYNDLWFGGRTRNPWNIQQGSSGSSAGSAAATAAGLLPFAIGTETHGSIVSPSHTCGTTGLRPTFGSVSRSGAMVLSWSLDKAGPICRSAEDAAIVFYYIKGTDGKDASAIERPFNYKSVNDLSKLKIAYPENYFRNIPKNSPQWAVLDKLKSLGASLTPIIFPDSLIYPFNIMDVVISAESAAAFDELTRSNRDDLIRRQDKYFWPNTFRAARLIPAVEYINANRHRSKLIVDVNEIIKQFDVIVTPSFAGAQLGITNLTGHPVVVMPVGFTANGLPTSITFLGNLYDDATILAVADRYQKATQFHKQHPEKFKQ
ncbi:MAG: amidase [Chitinophagaceae bacterium]|nr:MAG: amidase [Chitinophagaceae bacterium]